MKAGAWCVLVLMLLFTAAAPDVRVQPVDAVPVSVLQSKIEQVVGGFEGHWAFVRATVR